MDTTDMVLHFDGACVANPGGPMGWGFHLDTADGDRIGEQSGTVTGYPHEESSCNTAEFHALLAGLEWATGILWFRIGTLTVRGDSKLVVNIVGGEWNAKKQHLADLNALCQKALSDLRRMGATVVIEWVPREDNQRADELSVRDLPKPPATIPAAAEQERGSRPPGESRLPEYGRGMSRDQMVESIRSRAVWYGQGNPQFDIVAFMRWVHRQHESMFRQYFTDIHSLVKRKMDGKKPKCLDWLD